MYKRRTEDNGVGSGREAQPKWPSGRSYVDSPVTCMKIPHIQEGKTQGGGPGARKNTHEDEKG